MFDYPSKAYVMCLKFIFKENIRENHFILEKLQKNEIHIYVTLVAKKTGTLKMAERLIFENQKCTRIFLR